MKKCIDKKPHKYEKCKVKTYDSFWGKLEQEREFMVCKRCGDKIT